MKLTLAAALTLAAVPAFAAEPLKLGCDGPIRPDDTFASLKKTFGAQNVRVEQVDGAEGETIEATVIFPDDPAARIEVFFDDAKRIDNVTVRDDSRVSIEGLALGQDVASVEARNKKPFTVLGFGWDMGGNVSDWKDGALGTFPNGCSVSVRFGPADDAPEKTLDQISGDGKTLSSADKKLRAVRPRISSVMLGWARP